jgi:primosomal protein N' (replication factor Y)
LHRYVEVCFETPQDGTYFYRLPAAFPGDVTPGLRVRAPLGPRRADGYVLRLVTESEVRSELAAKLAGRRKAGNKAAGGLGGAGSSQGELFAVPDDRGGRPDDAPDPLAAVREVIRPSDDGPLFQPPLLELARWMSGHYAASLGECLGALLPGPVKKHTRPERVRHAELAVPVEAARALLPEMARRAPQQAVLLETLLDCGDRLTVGELLLAADAGESAVRALVEKKLVRVTAEYQQDRVYMGYDIEETAGLTLSAEQAAVTDDIVKSLQAAPGTVHLVRGVTGSGKTEVYIRAAAEAVRRGYQAIVLLPEISLTPQTCARFRGRFGGLAVLHSHLTDGQRAEEWARILAGRAEVVIGARSAVFAPVPRLGLIVVDEEHETSYKQDSPPRYSARDVAVQRARLEGAVCVLGSATPCLESFEAALSGRYRLHHMEQRVAGRSLPPVEIVDVRREVRERRFFTALSHRLRELLRQTIDSGGAAIMFLNRRGWSTALLCNRCGFVARCERCQVALVYHRDRDASVCHYCGQQRQLGRNCPDCAAPGLKHIGLGTEQVADEVQRLFPAARVGRLDRDVMARRAGHVHVLSDFREGRLDVLVGTQMVGKGLDFPNVTLVGMVSADTALNLPDFRAAERTFQLVSQVAGRAGRGERAGRVAVQTAMPGHPAILFAARHDYLGFAQAELDSRRECFWPPYARLARAVVRGRDAAAVQERCAEVGRALTQAIDALGPALPGSRSPLLLGPAPCPLEKLEDEWRWHLLLKCPLGDWLSRLLPALRRAAAGQRRKVRVTVDVDPVGML